MNATIDTLQQQRDAVAARRAEVRPKATGDNWSPEAVEAGKQVKALDEELGGLDRRIWAARGALSVEDLQAERDAYAAEREALFEVLPDLKFRAERDPQKLAQFQAAARRHSELTETLGGIDRGLYARRQERGQDLAQAWLRDGRMAALQQFVRAEAAALEHVAALLVSHGQAVRAGASAQAMGAPPQTQIARLRELKAYLLAPLNRGVRFDLSPNVKRFVEDA